MYAYEGMIDGFVPSYTSDIHKAVIYKICIDNPRCFSPDKVRNNAAIINALSLTEVSNLTFQQARNLGCYL